MLTKPTTNRQQWRAFALLGLVMIFWAGNTIVARAVAGDVPPLTLAFVRWAGAVTFIAPFAIGSLRRDWPAMRKGWRSIAVLGLLGIGAFNALLYSGLQDTTATNALLLQAAVPALVVLLERVLFKVTTGALQVTGTLASIFGVAVIVFRGEPAAVLDLHLGTGDALILASVVVWSLYTVLLRTRPAVSGTSFIAATFAIGVVTMAPLAWLEWQAGERIVWSWGVGAAFLYVSLLPSLLSYFIYNSAAETVGPARAGQAITMMPLFGALLSALLLGEVLHAYHAAGMAFICIGIAMGALAMWRGSALQQRQE